MKPDPKREDFHFYIPAAYRRLWADFREHVDNSGLRACDVLISLVRAYMADNAKSAT